MVENAASDILGFTKLGYLPWNLIRGFKVFTERKKVRSTSAHRSCVETQAKTKQKQA